MIIKTFRGKDVGKVNFVSYQEYTDTDGNLIARVPVKETIKLKDWNDVEDIMPEENTMVLVYTLSERVVLGSLQGDFQWTIETMCGGPLYWHGKDFSRATHWMPLPERPEII